MKIDSLMASCAAAAPTADQKKDIAAMGTVLTNWKNAASVLGKTIPLTWEELAAAYEKVR